MCKRRRQQSDEPGKSQQSSQNMHEVTGQRQCTINLETIQSTRRLRALGSFGKSFFQVKNGLIKYQNEYKLLQETTHWQAAQHTSGRRLLGQRGTHVNAEVCEVSLESVVFESLWFLQLIQWTSTSMISEPRFTTQSLREFPAWCRSPANDYMRHSDVYSQTHLVRCVHRTQNES